MNYVNLIITNNQFPVLMKLLLNFEYQKRGFPVAKIEKFNISNFQLDRLCNMSLRSTLNMTN